MIRDEVDLAHARVALVADTRPPVSIEQVWSTLLTSFDLEASSFLVRRGYPEDFLITFWDPRIHDHILHSVFPAGSLFQLTFRPWTRQSSATVGSMLFRVLLELKGILTHAWRLSTAEHILSSSCSTLVPTLATVALEDLGCFCVVAWCIHPDLIPAEVSLIEPDPVEE